MAKRQFKKITITGRRRRQQLLFKYSTVCVLVLVLLLARLDSSGGSEVVDALSNSLNGNRNRLQQNEDNIQQIGQEQQDEELQQQQQQQQELRQQHVDTGEPEEVHNYVVSKSNPQFEPYLKTFGNGQILMGRPLNTLKLIKRAPGGFVGMRGKKDTNRILDNDQNFVDEESSYEENNFPQPWEQMANGNSDDINANINNEHINWNDYAAANVMRYKKAPNTFYGVRGKKFTPIAGVNPSGGETMRWNQFLQKLDEDRMRNMIMENVMDKILEKFEINGDEDDDDDDDPSSQNDITKRAPTGFTGMRGKRPAFLGNIESIEPSSMESGTKRGVGSTFVGVRGKKDVSHQTFKRSPIGGSGSSIMGGPSGKPQRFTDFGNKFVAVRGKKTPLSYYNNNGEQWRPINGWIGGGYMGEGLRRSQGDTASVSSALLASSGRRAQSLYGAGILYDNNNNNDKRTPSGFQGMRGKRPATLADNLISAN